MFCRLRYKLTLRDLSEIMRLPGFTVSHESICRWEAKLLPVIGEALRKRRHGAGLVRVGMPMKPISRSMATGATCMRRSIAMGTLSTRVTADGHNSHPCAIRSTRGRDVRHSTSV